MRRFIWVALVTGALVTAARPGDGPLLAILSEELDRNFRILKEAGDPAPYFLAYEVTDQRSHVVSATLGALQSSADHRARYLDVTARVGSPQLDNYHRLPGERPPFPSLTALPIEDGVNAIRQRVWLDTDHTYRQAAERLVKIRTSSQVKVAPEEAAADFSNEEPASYSGRYRDFSFSPRDWEAHARKWSAAFASQPHVLTSGVTILAQNEVRYVVNSEGTRVVHGRGFARIAISAQAKALDGTDLATSEMFEAEDPARLPGDKVVMQAVERVSRDLEGLLRAPEAEPFAGPAILSGRAAGVFFHEIFGHRIEGHRQKDESEGQTFAKSVGTKVLPDFLSVISDPTVRSAAGIDLNGAYEFDDEGVKASRVTVVEDGILKTFLMSRTPLPGIGRSNGHGRRQPGFEVVSRQSNLLVESKKRVPEAQLRHMLLDEVRRHNKPYGLYFRQVTGGYTQTARRGLQAFTVIPILVYRVYADGRPDELIRGADIVGTPLASFAKILATSDHAEVFNGYCGAESGSVPVSAVAPAILVSEIEVQKKEKGQDRPPLLPRPEASR